MPRIDESKQNKGVNNNTRNKQMAIDMEYYNRLNHLRFKSPYLGAKYQQRVIPVRTLNGVQDVFVDNRVDAAGHLVQEGTSNGKKVYRAQDIWKFNPDEYKQKWSSYDLDSKAVLGLKILDKLGTPVIVRTPWLYR